MGRRRSTGHGKDTASDESHSLELWALDQPPPSKQYFAWFLAQSVFNAQYVGFGKCEMLVLLSYGYIGLGRGEVGRKIWEGDGDVSTTPVPDTVS